MPKRKRVSGTTLNDRVLPAVTNIVQESATPNGTVNGVVATSSKKRRVTKNTSTVVGREETVETKHKVVAPQSKEANSEGKLGQIDTAPRPEKNKKSTESLKEVKIENGDAADKPVKRKRKTKEEKEAEAMPLAARTVGHKLFIGAHVSGAGGVHNSVANSVHIGANAFALFLKSQRKWANPPLADDHCLSFHEQCKHHFYDQASHVVPHGSYLVNLAHIDPARTSQAYESYLDDLQRCERLGIMLYNIHPGNTASNDRGIAIAHLASNINRAHKETKSVITLLENMAAGGNVLGSTFEDLRDIISHVTDKSRIGVCLDTCHAFAAGYDLRSPAAYNATMSHLDKTVGLKYLRALHINDSKAPLDSRRDLHANIGTGFLGLRAFHNIVNDTRLAGLPLVLETPIEVRDADGALVKDEKGKEKEDKGIWAREIKMLENLVGMSVEDEVFLQLERELSKKGEPERTRLAGQFKRRKEKEAKKENKTRKAKKKAEDTESDLSELEV